MINAVGTLNIVEICKNYNFVKSIICITSDKCYQNNFSTKGFKENDKLGGSDPYSASKACAEIIVKSYLDSFYLKNNRGLATGRAGNVIGGGDWSPNRLIPDSVKWIIKNKEIYLRNPNFNRPWQHVLEPLYGYLILALKLYNEPKKYSGPWNFGSKKNTVTSVYDVVKKIIKHWGKGKVKINKKKQFYEQENLQLNISKANKILKWYPKLSIDNSVKETVDWYKYVYLYGSKKAEEITSKQIENYMNKILN
jgi:CDP-glucose 4,6-dehydratase